MPQKVDNPRLSDLKLLRQHLRSEATMLDSILHRASSDTGGKGDKKSWVGSSADKWRSDADGKRRQIKSDLRRMISEVNDAIARCPEKVTITEAKTYSLDAEKS